MSVETIDRHVGFLLVDHPFFDMKDALAVDDEENVTRLLTASGSPVGPYLLQHVLDLVDIAIAQQSLLAGDILLADLETAWRSNTSNWPPIAAALADQPLLRQNLLTYIVRRAVIANSSLEAYAAVYPGDGGAAGPMAAMKAVLGAGFELGWVAPPAGQPVAPDPVALASSTGWQLAIPGGGPKVPLPAPDAVINGQLLQNSQLETLLALRMKIAEELAGYELPGEMLTHELDLISGIAFANGGASPDRAGAFESELDAAQWTRPALPLVPGGGRGASTEAVCGLHRGHRLLWGNDDGTM